MGQGKRAQSGGRTVADREEEEEVGEWDRTAVKERADGLEGKAAGDEMDE